MFYFFVEKPQEKYARIGGFYTNASCIIVVSTSWIYFSKRRWAVRCWKCPTRAPFQGAPRCGGGPQGSAASGGVKRPRRLGRHLPLHKQSAGQRLRANPDCCKTAIFPMVPLSSRGAQRRGDLLYRLPHRCALRNDMRTP